MSKNMKILELKHVDLSYSTDVLEVKVLRDINLEINKGEFIVVIGPSGAGKSSLLYVMSGLEKPTNGDVIFKDKNICKMNPNEVAEIRLNEFGFIFQFFNLVSTLDVEENVQLPLQLQKANVKSYKEKIKELIQKVGLSDRAKHMPSQLSGGQQQRVAIARSLINDPEIIFADEPTGNLDTKTSEEVMELMSELCHAQEKTIILVTHNTSLIQYASRVIKVVDGRIQEDYKQ